MTGYCALVVAKAPVAGRVKTRLCPPATPEQAADIAAASLLDTLDAVLSAPDAVPVVALAGELHEAARRSEVTAALSRCSTVVAQHGGGFAQRLVHAHRDTAAHRPGLPVVQIGMDTPQVSAELLTGVVAMLAESGAVLGPASDGGWWTLALRDPEHAAVLADVPMSRPDTGELTRAALSSAGLDPRTAPELSDVDTPSDARVVADAAPGTRFARAAHRLFPDSAEAAGAPGEAEARPLAQETVSSAGPVYRPESP